MKSGCWTEGVFHHHDSSGRDDKGGAVLRLRAVAEQKAEETAVLSTSIADRT